MKKINELSEKEAEEILKFVYPDDKDNYFIELKFESEKLPNGGQYVTFALRPIIGILYHGGQDRCILHFDNHKVIYWLCKNGYDVLELLESVQNDSKLIKDLDNFMYSVHWLRVSREHIEPKLKHEYDLEYVLSELVRIENDFYNE